MGTTQSSTSEAASAVTLLSPPDQVVRPARIERLVLRFARDARPSHVKVSAQVTTNDAWRTVGSAAGPGDVVLDWPAEWRNPRTIVERLKIEFAFAGDSEASVLSRVLLYPREAPATRASP